MSRKIIKKLEEKIACYQNEIDRYLERIAELYKNCYLTCKTCGNCVQVRKVTRIANYWYNVNIGSPCGGYYQYNYESWKCPKCMEFRKNKLSKDDSKKIPTKSFRGTGEYKPD